MPKAVPLISTSVYWAKSVLLIGWRKKLKKKKKRAMIRSKRSVVNDMAKMNPLPGLKPRVSGLLI